MELRDERDFTLCGFKPHQTHTLSQNTNENQKDLSMPHVTGYFEGLHSNNRMVYIPTKMAETQYEVVG